MRNAIILFAFVIAGVVFCCAFACTTTEEVGILLNTEIAYTEYLTAIANCGVFLATCFTALYAVVEYQNHKKEHRIKLLGEYNQRYSTDRNIQKVITWMLKVAIVDNKGDIVGADPNKYFYKPDINTKEMFMRFFEELYLHVNNNSIDKRQACQLFSFYAIKFDEIKEFRLDITDYRSKKELIEEERNSEETKDEQTLIYWINFREYVEEMKNEWKKITRKQLEEQH